MGETFLAHKKVPHVDSGKPIIQRAAVAPAVRDSETLSSSVN